MNCDIIKDLLPLYVDGVCSEESRMAVSEHIAVCGECRALWEEMSKNDTVSFEAENSIVELHAKKEKRKALTLGAVFSGIYMIPVLVCLIVNLCTGMALDWFFIVLASLLTAFSLTALPMLVPKNKLLCSVSAGSASLVLLYFVCSIYTGGDWFGAATFSSLFGISVTVLPLLMNQEPLKNALQGFRAITAAVVDTVLYVLMMYSISEYIASDTFLQVAAGYSVPLWCLIILTVLVFAYFKTHKAVKCGITSMALGVYLFFGGCLSEMVIGITPGFPRVNLTLWNEAYLDGNVRLICLATFVTVGIILTAIGIKTGERK